MNSLPFITQVYFLCAGAGSVLLVAMAAMGAAHGGGHAHVHTGGHSGGHGHAGATGHSAGGGQAGSSPGAAHGHSGQHATGNHSSISNSGGKSLTGRGPAPLQTAPGAMIHGSGGGAGAKFLMLCSPTTICAFVATFGASGLIASSLLKFVPLILTVPLAAICGLFLTRFILGWMGWLEWRMFQSGTFSQTSLIGYRAEVTVSIEQGRTGEILCDSGGPRYTVSAKASKPDSIFRPGALVCVCDFIEGVAIVEPLIDEITMTKLPIIRASAERLPGKSPDQE